MGKPCDGKMGKVHQSEICLNKYAEKILLQVTNHDKAVQNILESL